MLVRFDSDDESGEDRGSLLASLVAGMALLAFWCGFVLAAIWLLT